MDVAAMLGYVRATWPYFNASLRRTQPNHLLLFPGDMAMDLPRPRMQPPLLPEVDASQVSASDFEPDECSRCIRTRYMRTRCMRSAGILTTLYRAHTYR